MSSVTWYLEGSFLKVTPAHFVFSNDGLRALDRGIYINVCEAIYIFHTLKFKLSWSHITLHKRLTFDRSFILARKNWQKEADHHSSRFAPLDFLLTCNKVSKNEKYASLKFSSDFVIFYDAVMMHFNPWENMQVLLAATVCVYWPFLHDLNLYWLCKVRD